MISGIEPKDLAVRLGAVAVEQEALNPLIQKTLDWYWDVGCKEYQERPDCPGYDTAQQKLHEILQDRIVHAIEAPLLFEIFSKVAGEDQVLTLEELTQKPLRDNLLEDEVILISVEGDKEKMDHTLEGVEKFLGSHLAFFEKMKNELEEESLSFWNFVSAENMLGLSTLFTRDGSTFSDGELQGLRRLLHALREYQEGLRLFRRQLAQGEINAFQRDAARFLESPLADAMIPLLKYFLGGKYHAEGRNKDPVDRTEQVLADFAGALASLAHQTGAVKSAYAFAGQMTDEVGGEYEDRIKQKLPGGLSEFYDTQFVAFGNALASLDSIALGALGGGAGRWLGGMNRVATGYTLATEKLGGLRYLIPGTRVLPVPGGARLGQKWAAEAVNGGAELLRFGAYHTLGEKIGGKPVGDFVARVYLFSGGLFNGLETRVSSRLADDILANRFNPTVEKIIQGGADDQRLAALAKRITGHAGERRIGFARGANQEVLEKKIAFAPSY